MIGNVYRPNTAPYASIRRSTEYLSKSIEYIQQKYRHDSIVILGDFNIDLLGEENNDTLDFISELVSKGFICICICVSTATGNIGGVFSSVVEANCASAQKVMRGVMTKGWFIHIYNGIIIVSQVS